MTTNEPRIGRLTTIYEYTPHSGGYYAVSASYWANGALDTLSGLPGLPTMTYAVDGEGRPSKVSASSGQNPVSSDSYNVASQATAVNFGSGDSDSFNYDSNTDRITQYKFTVGTQSVTGGLTWNANGTLTSLAVTDPFDSTNTQNCSYGYDDLARLSSANCGSGFSDTYWYDPLGNIEKSGTFQFQPAYSWQTNQLTSIGSFTPTYDSNGDVTNDGLNTFTWDAYGKTITADSVTTTYDALGRMVEEDNGGTYTEIVWGPTGTKLALMNGQTLKQAFVPLPGGATAVYTSSGLQYYRHADWLGSVRLVSTTSQTVSGDTAYAPFGEPYAPYGAPVDSFTGQNADTASSLYDFPMREYGYQGRWPSPDPAGSSAFNLYNPQTLDLYSYTNNDPLDAVDPSGLCPLVVAGIDEAPGSSGGKALIAYAQGIGANVVFPYADHGIAGGIASVAAQAYGIPTEATQLATRAIQASASDPGGLTSVITFSGGAEAYSAAAGAGPEPANVAYLSPGTGGEVDPLPLGGRGTFIYEGTQGAANLAVEDISSQTVESTLAEAGLTGKNVQMGVIACKHAPGCFTQALKSGGFNAGPACKNPKVFGPRGGGGGRTHILPPPPPPPPKDVPTCTAKSEWVWSNFGGWTWEGYAVYCD